MIRLITTLIVTLFLFISTSFAQEITGDWYGQLAVQGTKLRINFHVSEKDGTYTTTMDSPDQGAKGISTTKTIVNNNVLEIILDNMKINFIGELKGDKIDGIFKQNGMEFPLVLTHQEIEKKSLVRPQEPKKPYQYKSEEVFFINKEANNIKLAGTLSLPNNVKNPAVAILISGSGPQNRDEELLGHKPFLVISDYLTNNGIAVLRFDDRGVADSEGTQKNATSADFATDVAAAIAYLKTRKDIDSNKIGLIGHSEGGFIGPMVIAKDKSIAFFVSLAGPGVDGAEVLITQTQKAFELAGTSKDHVDFNNKMSKKIFDFVKTINDKQKLKETVKNYLLEVRKTAPKSIANELTDNGINNQVKSVTSAWMNYFIKTDPKQFLKKINCPVLALNGEKDFQVLPELNLNGIRKSLKNNKDVTTLELKGLNHLFQTCETGAFSEYSEIEETFAPKALKLMADWINERF